MTGLIDRALAVEHDIARAGEAYLRLVAVFGRSLGTVAGEAGEDDALSPEQRARIRATAWRLQNAFEAVTRPSNEEGLREAMLALSFLATNAGGLVVAWTGMMDELIEEAERIYGTEAGRGVYKREQLRAAVLTIAHRQAIDVPLVPGFLEPMLFATIAEFVVTHRNDNGLWEKADLPLRPSTRTRVTGPLVYFLRKGVSAIGHFMTGVAWRLVMGSATLSPGMNAAVGRVEVQVGATFEALRALRSFLNDNPDLVAAIARLLSIATQQAETFAGLSGKQKQAYAHDLVMAFLEQNGLVAEDGLWRRAVSGLLEVGIDATVKLFNKHGLFPFHG